MELENWMSNLKEDIKLCKVVLPATHDSGMSSLKRQIGAYVNPLSWIAHAGSGIAAGIDDLKSGGINDRSYQFTHNNYVTQLYTVAEQLKFGARQFDLRITRHNLTYRAFHGERVLTIAGLRGYGEKWAEICTGIAKFMKNTGGSEFIILKMDKQDDSSTDATMIKMLSNALNTEGYKGPSTRMDGGYVDQEKIQNLRGRLLVCSKVKVLKKWKTLGLNSGITLCEWRKDESGVSPAKKVEIPKYPVYLLLGGAEGGQQGKSAGIKGGNNVLDKQMYMKATFDQYRRTVGMRGIWFNTYSILRDIKVYSDQIWGEAGNMSEDVKKSLAAKRDKLWLDGDARQNVASLDFLDENKALYVISKNPPENWKS